MIVIATIREMLTDLLSDLWTIDSSINAFNDTAIRNSESTWYMSIRIIPIISIEVILASYGKIEHHRHQIAGDLSDPACFETIVANILKILS